MRRSRRAFETFLRQLDYSARRPSRAHRSDICTWLSTWNTLEWALIPRRGDQARSSVRRRSCFSALRSCSSAVRLCSSAVEGVEAVFGHGRRDAQIPVLGDQAGQVELPGEADPDHARSAFQRGDSVRAEGAIVETAPVAQAGAVGTEAEGGDEDEVEADLRREQLCGAEQLGVPV